MHITIQEIILPLGDMYNGKLYPAHGLWKVVCKNNPKSDSLVFIPKNDSSHKEVRFVSYWKNAEPFVILTEEEITALAFKDMCLNAGCPACAGTLRLEDGSPCMQHVAVSCACQRCRNNDPFKNVM